MTLLALGGSVQITGPAGLRVVGADDFFVGPFESALAPGSSVPLSSGPVNVPPVRGTMRRWP